MNFLKNCASFGLACGNNDNPPGRLVKFKLTLMNLLQCLFTQEVEFQVVGLGPIEPMPINESSEQTQIKATEAMLASLKHLGYSHSEAHHVNSALRHLLSFDKESLDRFQAAYLAYLKWVVVRRPVEVKEEK